MGSLNAGRRLASTFGRRSWWSSSTHPPRFIRVTTQSERVMRSHQVGWLAWNSGTSLAKKSWLSLMISRYVTSMSYLDWKASSVGRCPPFARSMYKGHWATVSWWARGGSVLGAATGVCLPAHAARNAAASAPIPPRPTPRSSCRRENDRSIHLVEGRSPLPPRDPEPNHRCILPQRRRQPGRGRQPVGTSNTNHPSTEAAGADASGEPAGGGVGSTTNSCSLGGTDSRSAASDAASVPARPRPPHLDAYAT